MQLFSMWGRLKIWQITRIIINFVLLINITQKCNESTTYINAIQLILPLDFFFFLVADGILKDCK